MLNITFVLIGLLYLIPVNRLEMFDSLAIGYSEVNTVSSTKVCAEGYHRVFKMRRLSPYLWLRTHHWFSGAFRPSTGRCHIQWRGHELRSIDYEILCYRSRLQDRSPRFRPRLLKLDDVLKVQSLRSPLKVGKKMAFSGVA